MVKRKSPEEHRKGDKGDKEDNFDKELDSLFTSSAGPSTVKSRKVDHKAQVKKVKDAVSSLNKSKPSTGRGDGGGGSNSNSDGDSDGDNKKDNDGHHSDNNINNQEDIDDETLAEFAKEMGRDDDDLKADDNEWEDDNEDNDDIHDKKKDTKKKQAPRVYKIEDETPEQKNNRTIFVGNVPAEAAKNKVSLRLFTLPANQKSSHCPRDSFNTSCKSLNYHRQLNTTARALDPLPLVCPHQHLQNQKLITIAIKHQNRSAKWHS